MPDVIVGFPDNPQVVSTNNLLLREIPLGFGWNWVSFNLGFPNNSLNSALSSLTNPGNDLIKSQRQYLRLQFQADGGRSGTAGGCL
jgi:hypothetical protein